MTLRIAVLCIIFLLPHTSAFAQSNLEEAGNEMLAGLAALAYGNELGLAEGCDFPKTGAYLARFKKKFFEVKISQAKKNQLMAEFERYRKDMYDVVMQAPLEYRYKDCAERKDSYLDSNGWKDDWIIGGN